MTKYYPLSSPAQTIIVNGPEGSWDGLKVHTLSVLEMNKAGYRFWGYYTGFDGHNTRRDMGLALSNDLENWIKYEGNPVVRKLRWGTVVKVGDKVQMFGTRCYSNSRGGSYIVRLSSPDGITFTEEEVVVPRVRGENNQNPFIFFDANCRIYRLYWFNDRPLVHGHTDYIKEKHSPDVTTLASARSNLVLNTSAAVLAAPSMIFADDHYWLTAETLTNGIWNTVAYVSKDAVEGFAPVENFQILADNDACFFQYIFDNRLNGFYSHLLPGDQNNWHLRRVYYDFPEKRGRVRDKESRSGRYRRRLGETPYS